MAEVMSPLLLRQERRRNGWRIVVAEFARRPRGQGNPARVDFDYRRVYRLEDRTRAVAGFFHTHPPGATGMSAIDEKTMRGWVAALGKPLWCVIRSGDESAAWEFRPGAAPRQADLATVAGRIVVAVVRDVRA